ncbi:DEAD/DEAH box helicase family protein [Chlamydiales bacterium]|nr:DEAD/DEAH box helicase family protein [Chlamydiales bacterium]
MRIKFKNQPYQTFAVESVTDCFVGQKNVSSTKYRVDPGKNKSHYHKEIGRNEDITGFKNSDIQLSDNHLLKNINEVQKRLKNPVLSNILKPCAGCKVNLDIEMETGTGKTYCYIKTIYEMNKLYGWSKFIIVVPSIAIREGVYKSLEMTTDHFAEAYGKKIRYFIYNSKQLHDLESFSSDAGINVMIINIQAFNATGKDARRIYEELDDFQSRRPIDLISSNRPILILDEPQKMEGKKTIEALSKFKPLMILRYSATHRTTYNKIYELDALDAYNQKLVKKISARGISVKGLAGSNAYLYFESIKISNHAPVAQLEIEVSQKSGIKRILKNLEKGDDLFTASNELDQYKGFVVSHIDALTDTIEFTKGLVLRAGEATGDITESTIRQIQIREAIKVHLEKEQRLFQEGIKVLSLFFIDEVVKYRDYSQTDELGDYARIFEEEYEKAKIAYFEDLPFENEDYKKYLSEIPVRQTHNGYFSIDRKTKRLTNPAFKTRGENAGLSDDVDAYDLILRDKERLLSFEEPVRFIFSHSALREGWDNPNVFVICMLKPISNDVSRHQEVGRGLRLSVNRNGERMDHPSTVHEINNLTVVANESYKEFVESLQNEICETLSSRPRKADVSYFKGKPITTIEGSVKISEEMANDIHRYLIKNGYIDNSDKISEKYHNDKSNNDLASLPDQLAPYKEQIFGLINNIFSDSHLPEILDDRKPKTNHLNANFERKEFKELWSRINRRAAYRVEFDSNELIHNCIKALDNGLKVTPLQYTVQSGSQHDQISDDQLRTGQGFELKQTAVEMHNASIHSTVEYDLLGKLAEKTKLTRKTIAEILKGIQPGIFDQFKQNPEHFISEASRLINEQKATIIIERLSYDEIAETHDMDIFTAGQRRQDFSRASEKLKKHIYDYAITDFNVEKEFVKELDSCNDVVVYAKLPRGFFIPTPVGDYNPDWAISFRDGSVKHVYFVAETKGTMSTMELRGLEEKKIECARKFFDEINRKINPEHVKYDVVTSYGKLMEVVGAGNRSP